ncbi:MAG: DUF5683 domain-containing protein [Bacteroidales bacterium]|nr:DUF5683 domain-containing protein [Bacteroidales bacterium]
MELSGKIAFILLFSSVMTCGAQAQDTVRVRREKVRKYTIEPVRSTMFAAALPGLGQIYNRKYWKVPFVYAGFGALGYAVTFNTQNYNTFINAYQDFTDIIPETDSYLDLLVNQDPATYDPVLHPETFTASNEAWVKTSLRNGVDYYRKYRDLSYIGIAAWYLFTIIDAHVDASLSDYDISDDLKVYLLPVSASYARLSPGITFSITRTF